MATECRSHRGRGWDCRVDGAKLVAPAPLSSLLQSLLYED